MGQGATGRRETGVQRLFGILVGGGAPVSWVPE
jgi:hypothetical protein